MNLTQDFLFVGSTFESQRTEQVDDKAEHVWHTLILLEFSS